MMKPDLRVTGFYLIALSTVMLLAPAAAAQPKSKEEAVRDFYAAYNARKLEPFVACYSEEVVFEDRTLGLTMKGRAELQKNYTEWFRQNVEHRWELQDTFYSGDYAIVQGVYGSRFDGKEMGWPGVIAQGQQSFVTVLRFRQGLIAEHIDYMDFDSWDNANPWLVVPSVRRVEPKFTLSMLAKRLYLWSNQHPPDVEKVMLNYADDMVFEDPTWGVVTRGKSNFRQGFAQVTKDNAPLAAKTVFTRLFLSGNYIVLSGVYSQKRKADSGQEDRVAMKFVTALEVNKGLITRHTDFYEMDKLKESK